MLQRRKPVGRPVPNSVRATLTFPTQQLKKLSRVRRREIRKRKFDFDVLATNARRAHHVRERSAPNSVPKRQVDHVCSLCLQ